MISFKTLRDANRARLPVFKNSLGERAHSKSDGSDWSPAQWLQAVVGELGEYANLRKKFERGDIDAATFSALAAKELADVTIYLDILAFQLGIDLGQSVVEKFNEVSKRVAVPVFIVADRVENNLGDVAPTLRERVHAALNRAVEGGYNLRDYHASTLARDLINHDSDFEKSIYETLLPHIESWLEKKGGGRSARMVRETR